MDEYYTVIENLPPVMASELKQLSPAKAGTVQEIRLRINQPLQFTIGGKLVTACALLPQANMLRRLSGDALQQCFLTLCGHSAYE